MEFKLDMNMEMKIVPDVSPNADGEWIAVPPELAQAIRDNQKGWDGLEAILMNASAVPAGHHIVQFRKGRDH